jgi:AraC-like DNA-binding protein
MREAEPKLTATERRLVEALFLEPTMEAVATRIGVSSRHCRRLVRDLLDAMGVATARQATAVAAVRGYLSHCIEGPAGPSRR